MNQRFFPFLAGCAIWLGASCAAHAQWLTQSLVVKPGWTAVYLHVDASYEDLDQLVGADTNNPIDQIWLWEAPASTLQFVTSPQSPLAGNNQWAYWKRSGPVLSSTLGKLIPNAAYLIHSTATTNYQWDLLGKPAAPDYSWTTTGLNFLGFPTPPTNAPAFDAFLSLAPALQSAAEIYQYVGGDLSAANPSRLFAYHTTPVTRGQAFWIRSGNYFNDYFGPFQVVFSSSSGVAFGNSMSQFSFHLRNTTATNVTVSLQMVPSETPPAGQPSIADTPPVLIRGDLNTTNLTYAYGRLSPGATQSWTLAPANQPGSDITVVMGLDRYQMTNNPGALYAGVLRFTDSFGYSEVNVPVSAKVSSFAGLWVGNAMVTQVANYLKTYQRDTSNNLVVSSNGSYIVTSVNTNLGPVAQAFPLRLILHNDGTNAVLLQRVYYGLDTASNLVVATGQAALDPAHLDSARRISSVTLPWSASNAPWPFSGQLEPGGTLTTTVFLPYDDQASNPFLHTYHPDHDNLDATFQHELPRGAESYDITRQITLSLSPPGNDFNSLTRAGQAFSGIYQETITLNGRGNASRTFHVSGVFAINRISNIATLTEP